MDCSNSVVIARLSKSTLTVRLEPAFVKRVVTSSLKANIVRNGKSIQWVLNPHLEISVNLASKCQLTRHSPGNTLPCSSSWVWRSLRNQAKRRDILSSCPASSFVRKIRLYSLSSRATKRSMTCDRKSKPRTSTTRHPSEMRDGLICLLVSWR